MILNTIQKRNKLNNVKTIGEAGCGNAYHSYEVSCDLWPVGEQKETIVLAKLHFQNGGRNVENSIHGLTGEDLLEIARHRLQCFQTSEYQCRENAIALTHIEEALMWLNRRAEDRAERNVLGINSK